MRFLDDGIKLKIKDKQSGETYDFKAYLEKSAVQVKTIDTSIQYAPLNFTNNMQFLKTQYSVDFSFNVFAEDRDESFQNYDKLHDLLKIIKPTYKTISDQYLPNAGNIFGLIQVQFAGLPKISKRPELDIYVTNFAFNLNQDMGFLQAPYNPDDRTNENRQLLYAPGEQLLVPVAYRVDISGRVLLPLEESIRVTERANVSSVKNLKSIADILNKYTPEERRNNILETAKNLVGERLYSLPQSNQEKIFSMINDLKNKYFVDNDLNPAPVYADLEKANKEIRSAYYIILKTSR